MVVSGAQVKFCLAGAGSMLVFKFSAASSCCDSIAAVEALASLGPESQKHSMSSASVSSEPGAAKAP